MHIVGAIIGAVMTGIFWWILFGNGREAINYWLDKKNDETRAKQSASNSLQAREQERRAALRAIADPREAAVAVMIAVAESRGHMTDEQQAEIKAQMRTVLGFDNALEHHLTIAQHASRSASSPATVIDETADMFRRNLNRQELDELVSMVEAVCRLHGGPTDLQASLIERLKRSVFGA